MPWREMEPMEQRLELIREYESGLLTMTELIAQYGVSRKTAYKWLARYEQHGVGGLSDRSRRPHGCPHATEAEVIDAIVAPATASALGGQKVAPGAAPTRALDRLASAVHRL
jgi:transposase-like protein